MSQVLALTTSDALFGIASSRARRVARQIVLVIGGSLLMAGCAQISIKLPFTPVPITGQTFGVLLIGGAFGWAMGAVSMALYVLEGIAGAPFFATGAHGWSIIVGPSGGYLLSYPFAAALVGFLSSRKWDRKFGSATGAMLTGNIVIYLFGIPWLAHFEHASPISQKVLLLGLYPFIIGDLLKLYLAGALLPSGWRFTERAVHRDDSAPNN